jgi:hypothetical protein
MTMTRKEFLRGAAASLAAACGLCPGGLALAQAPSGLTLEALAALTDPDKGNTLLGEAKTLIDYYIRTSAAGARFAGPQTPPANAGSSPNPNFFHRLAAGLMCKTVANIGDHNLNGLVKGRESTEFVAGLIRSGEALAESEHIYDRLFLARRGLGGVTFSQYLQSGATWAAQLAHLLTLENWLRRTRLEAISGPDKVRYELKVMLYKLRKLDPKRHDEVINAWRGQPHDSVFYLATTDKWPGNFFIPTYDRENPIDGAVRQAAGQTRDGGSRQDMLCVVFTTYNAENLAAAVREYGGPLGLFSGGGYSSEDTRLSCQDDGGGWWGPKF